MSIAKKDLWQDENGEIVDKQPEGRGRTVAVKGAKLSDADIKEFKIPKDALEDDRAVEDLPPNIVMSGPAGQAFVTGQPVPEGQRAGERDEKDEAKDAAGKKDKKDKDGGLL
jgi:hypothetical protein